MVSSDQLEALLRECQQAAPEPWYPSADAERAGAERATIDAGLDRLRMGGLVRLTDWVQGKGQGYVLTPEGALVLQNPQLLRRLRDGRPLPIEPTPEIAIPQPATSTWQRGEAVRAVILNPGKPVVTWALLGVTCAAFVIEALLDSLPEGDPRRFDLANLLFLNRPAVVVRDQWWRLLSYCLVHGGLLHLACNMYFLFSLGPLVEAMWGSARYLFVYLVAGLGGGVAVVLSNSAAVGASGALCGLLTSMAVWVFLNRFHLGELSAHWLRGIGTNLILIAVISILPGVSLAGHLGGALAGAAVAFPLIYQRFGNGAERWLGLVGALAVPVFLVGLVVVSITGDEKALRSHLRARERASTTGPVYVSRSRTTVHDHAR